MNDLDVPFATLLKTPSLALAPSTLSSTLNQNDPIIFVCKKGNDSFLAARALRRYLAEQGELKDNKNPLSDKEDENDLEIKDLIGGLQAWSREIDGGFPIY